MVRAFITIGLLLTWVAYGEDVMIFEVDDLTPGQFAPEVALDDLMAEYLEVSVQSTRVPPVHYGDAGSAVIAKALPPGRYQAIFEIAAQPYTKGPSLACQVTVNGKQTFRKPLASIDFPNEGFARHAVDFLVPPGPFKQVDMRLRWDNWRGREHDIDMLRMRRITVRRQSGPIYISKVWPNKLLYAPGEVGTVVVAVANGGPATNVQVVLSEETVMNDVREIGLLEQQLAAGATSTIELPYHPSAVQFGRRLFARVQRDGEVLDEASDVATVSAHVWDVALGAINNGILHSTGRYGERSDEVLQGQVAAMRANYSNWLEIDFWAPDDWGNLTPAEDQWVSGQAARWQDKAVLKRLIATAQTHGIRAITYGKGTSGGPSAWELLRRDPELYLRSDSTGRWGGNPDLWDFEHWNDAEFHQREYKKFNSVWHRMSPDLGKEKSLQHGIEQLIASTAMFGWDGVRFDGHFTAVDDVVSAHNMRQMKQRLLAAYPDYVFGYNLCSLADHGGVRSHENREAMAGGGMWMQEGMGSWTYDADRRYRKWRHYAENEQRSATQIQQAGGSYHYIYRLGNCLSDANRFYKFVIGVFNGVHPCYGGHAEAPGSRNWGRFLTRWGMLFWHRDRRALDLESLGISGSVPEHVLWRHWAKLVPISTTRELMVIPFLALPDTPRIQNTKVLPSAVDGVLLEMSQSALRKRVKNLYWLTSDQLVPKPLAMADGVIKLPTLSPFGILVAELAASQDYRAVTPPVHTEAVDPAALARSRASGKKVVVLDPLRPELNVLPSDGRVLIEQSERHSWSMKRAVFDDPKAVGGQAAGGDASVPTYCTGAYFWELSPGAYKLTARVKVTGAGMVGHLGCRFYENVQRTGNSWSPREGTPDSYRHTYRYSELQDPNGEYVTVTFPATYHHYGVGFLTVFMQGHVPQGASGEARVMVDWVKAEKLRSYSDHDVAAQLGLEDAGAVEVGSAEKVLWVRGMYDDCYRLEEGIADAFAHGQTTRLYQRDLKVSTTELGKFGTVILPNVPCDTIGTMGRKAYHDWVRAGGHLIILGGSMSLGQGGLKGSFIEEVLPCRLLRPADVIKLAEPTALAGAGMTTAKLFYVHETEANPGASVQLRCGDLPMLMTRQAGRGRCTVFAGTVLGAAKDAKAAFWNHPRWPRLLAGAVNPEIVAASHPIEH